MGNIIIGLILIGIGFYFIIKAFYLNHHFIFLGWAEQKWGAGSGTTAYKVMGLALCLLGMFTLIGWVDIFGPAFGNTGLNGNSTNTNTPQLGNGTNKGINPANPAPVRQYYQNGYIAP